VEVVRVVVSSDERVWKVRGRVEVWTVEEWGVEEGWEGWQGW
jgi:hypothetical protein